MLVRCTQLAQQDPQGSPCADELRAGVDGTLDRTRANLAEVAAKVHRRAPGARVLLVGYPQIVPESGSCAALPLAKGDYAFVLHMIETLKPKTGRMGVVVPHGVLFRGAAEGKIRKQLVDENLLDAVIGLPEKLFYGTGIPAAILVFRRGKTDTNVMFIDASREYKDGKNQNQLTDENVAKIVETCRVRRDVAKYAHLASLAEIKENDYNLNIPSYVDTFEEEEQIDLAAVLAERKALKAELAKIEADMDAYLKELGYGA